MMMGMTYGMEGGTTGNFFLPISQTFNCTISEVSLYVSIKGIMCVLTIPFVVKALKKGNTRKTLSLATIAYALSLLAMALSPSIIFFHCAAAFLGISGSFLSTISVPTIINQWFTKKMGLALGISMAASGIFGSLAGPLLNEIILYSGWRSGYLIMASLIVVFLLPLMIFVIELKPRNREDAYGGYHVVVNQDELMEGRIHVKPFVLTILFGIALALSTGILFNLPTMLLVKDIKSQKSALIVSFVLIGATVWKLIYGYFVDFVSMKKVLYFAIISGVIGLNVIMFKNAVEYLFVGAFLYGSIVSLMTLFPPLMLKVCFKEENYNHLLTYVSMAVQFAYALSPMIFAYLGEAFNFQEVICICMSIALIALIIGSYNLKEKGGKKTC